MIVELITLILLALGLSMDTFAVSITTGLTIKNIQFKQAVRIAFVLGFFQTLMPLTGWFLGLQIKDYIVEFDHWIAFGLLGGIGSKMVYEYFKPEHETDELNKFNPERLSVLLGMAIATSIDALAVGVSFAFIETNIWLSLSIIGIITFIVGMLGMLFGKKAGHLFGKKMELVGGIVLIGIGLKILVEHLSS